MNAEEIINKYSEIEYKSTVDDNWYLLKELFPLIMRVEGDDETVCVDNGQAMGNNSDFRCIRITSGNLLTENDKGKFDLTTQIRLRVK